MGRVYGVSSEDKSDAWCPHSGVVAFDAAISGHLQRPFEQRCGVTARRWRVRACDRGECTSACARPTSASALPEMAMLAPA